MRPLLADRVDPDTSVEVYPDEDNAPAAADTTGMHWPVLVRRNQDLEYLHTARNLPLPPFEDLVTKILDTAELHRADAEAEGPR